MVPVVEAARVLVQVFYLRECAPLSFGWANAARETAAGAVEGPIRVLTLAEQGVDVVARLEFRGERCQRIFVRARALGQRRGAVVVGPRVARRRWRLRPA